MDEDKKKREERKQEEVIVEQIRDSYQSGFIDPEIDDRMRETK